MDEQRILVDEMIAVGCRVVRGIGLFNSVIKWRRRFLIFVIWFEVAFVFFVDVSDKWF